LSNYSAIYLEITQARFGGAKPRQKTSFSPVLCGFATQNRRKEPFSVVGKYTLHRGGAGAASPRRTTTHVQHVLAQHKKKILGGTKSLQTSHQQKATA
jgi:hypothetical protein